MIFRCFDARWMKKKNKLNWTGYFDSAINRGFNVFILKHCVNSGENYWFSSCLHITQYQCLNYEFQVYMPWTCLQYALNIPHAFDSSETSNAYIFLGNPLVLGFVRLILKINYFLWLLQIQCMCVREIEHLKHTYTFLLYTFELKWICCCCYEANRNVPTHMWTNDIATMLVIFICQKRINVNSECALHSIFMNAQNISMFIKFRRLRHRSNIFSYKPWF